jgi:hypothetical protein
MPKMATILAVLTQNTKRILKNNTNNIAFLENCQLFGRN